MDEGVQADHDEDGGLSARAHGPHGEHDAGVVVGLQEHDLLALEDEQDRVQELPVLADVEVHRPELEILPKAAALVAVGVQQAVLLHVLEQDDPSIVAGPRRVHGERDVVRDGQMLDPGRLRVHARVFDERREHRLADEVGGDGDHGHEGGEEGREGAAAAEPLRGEVQVLAERLHDGLAAAGDGERLVHLRSRKRTEEGEG